MISTPRWAPRLGRWARDGRLRAFGAGLAAIGMAATASAAVEPVPASAQHSVERAGQPEETIESGDEDHFEHDEPRPVTPAVDTPAGLNQIAPGSPWAGRWGPSIEPLASYEPQRVCVPGARPAVVAFASLLEQAYPQGRDLGITRACDAGRRSEHKEGRAYDWGVDIRVPAEREAAHQVLAWLLATDEHGNEFAMARRLGVMYVIWDNHIWSSSAAGAGWRVYTGPSPHTDHVHLSFSWDGATGRTSFWDAADLGVDVGAWLFGGFDLDDFPSRFALGGDRYRRELGASPGAETAWREPGSTEEDDAPAREGTTETGTDEPVPEAGEDEPPAPDPDRPPVSEAPVPTVTVPDVTSPIELPTTTTTITTVTVPPIDDVVDGVGDGLDPLVPDG